VFPTRLGVLNSQGSHTVCDAVFISPIDPDLCMRTRETILFRPRTEEYTQLDLTNLINVDLEYCEL
jgi:hypothetical protein